MITAQIYELNMFRDRKIYQNRRVQPGLCNKIRDEALSHNKSGSLISKA